MKDLPARVISTDEVSAKKERELIFGNIYKDTIEESIKYKEKMEELIKYIIEMNKWRAYSAEHAHF